MGNPRLDLAAAQVSTIWDGPTEGTVFRYSGIVHSLITGGTLSVCGSRALESSLMLRDALHLSSRIETHDELTVTHQTARRQRDEIEVSGVHIIE